MSLLLSLSLMMMSPASETCFPEFLLQKNDRHMSFGRHSDLDTPCFRRNDSAKLPPQKKPSSQHHKAEMLRNFSFRLLSPLSLSLQRTSRNRRLDCLGITFARQVDPGMQSVSFDDRFAMLLTLNFSADRISPSSC